MADEAPKVRSTDGAHEIADHEIFSFVPRLPGQVFQRLVYVPLRRSGAPHSPDKSGAAVSPIPKSRKDLRPPASLSRKNFMAVTVRRILSWRGNYMFSLVPY
jgi:hypothetical protein